MITPLGTLASPDVSFDHVHIDLVGPFPPSGGNAHLLTCVDCFTRWPEAIPKLDISAETVAKAIVSRWVVVFGAPSIITTERAPQFEFTLFKMLIDLLESKCTRTTTYQPLQTGLLNSSIKSLSLHSEHKQIHIAGWKTYRKCFWAFVPQ